ncbi:FISUMP domain-containing protein [uncultured Fibrobacter sp.]|uniref:FISUMP domain-containing protein n=1 Tax=uncultured Fibrobacter sp. TaxID=261512 RepID=UPI0025D1684E|nr:FISUMP domain-containing protein [uncultured Fibrobacter sp.]
MRESFKLILFAVLLVGFFSACSDDSSSAPEEPVDTFDASVVCPAEGVNAYGEPNRGTFTDARDGQVYKYTTIGDQVWMAENLKFNAPYSLCYDEIDGFCETFGRFYSLHVNGEFFDAFDQELLDTICPAGWHVPSVDEWSTLANNMGEGKKAARRLMSAFDFGEGYTQGSDDCGFNSLPGGTWLLNGELGSDVFYGAFYWTSTPKTESTSYGCVVSPFGLSFEINYPKLSIRCVRD